MPLGFLGSWSAKTAYLGRLARLAAWQVDDLNDVPCNEVVDLGSTDRPAKHAVDHHECSLAEHLAEFLKEVVGVGLVSGSGRPGW